MSLATSANDLAKVSAIVRGFKFETLSIRVQFEAGLVKAEDE